MTNHLITPLIPTTSARAEEFLMDFINDGTHFLSDAIPYWNPLHMIRDDDDYITACLSAMQMLSSELRIGGDPLGILYDILIDEDFVDSLLACDFASPILTLVTFD